MSLRETRLRLNQTLEYVAEAIGTDAGNLSRVERGIQKPSVWMAERLAKHFDGEITEMEILYPERYA